MRDIERRSYWNEESYLILDREEDSCEDRVLDEFSERLSVRSADVVEVVEAESVALRARDVGLEEVQVHLVSVEIGVVGFAVRVVHSEGLLFGEDAHDVAEQRVLVQTRLSVEEDDVPGDQVPVDGLVLGVDEECFGESDPLLVREVFQLDFSAVVDQVVRAGPLRAADDELAELLNVVLVDGFREGELFGDEHRDSDLVRLQVWVGGDDGSRCVVDSLAHHFHSEESGEKGTVR